MECVSFCQMLPSILLRAQSKRVRRVELDSHILQQLMMMQQDAATHGPKHSNSWQFHESSFLHLHSNLRQNLGSSMHSSVREKTGSLASPPKHISNKQGTCALAHQLQLCNPTTQLSREVSKNCHQHQPPLI